MYARCRVNTSKVISTSSQRIVLTVLSNLCPSTAVPMASSVCNFCIWGSALFWHVLMYVLKWISTYIKCAQHITIHRTNNGATASSYRSRGYMRSILFAPKVSHRGCQMNPQENILGWVYIHRRLVSNSHIRVSVGGISVPYQKVTVSGTTP